METLRQVEQQIEQIRGLRDIVQSMRTLASTYLKRAEQQLDSVRLYHETVVEALSQAAGPAGRSSAAEPSPSPLPMGEGTGVRAAARRAPEAVVLFATEQGLCGRFNEVMVDTLKRVLVERPGALIIVLGQRGRGVLQSAGIPVFQAYPAVTSPDGIPGASRRTAEELYRLYERGDVGAISLLHAVHQSVGRFTESFERVLPLDPAAYAPRRDAKHRRRQPPLTYVPRPLLLRRLVEEYYFIRFYWAFVETVASENSVRLQSMEAARSNIEETLGELEGRRRILRQNEITEELMDVISGAEAVTARRRGRR